MDEQVVERFEAAQRQVIALLADVVTRLEAGMLARDVIDVANGLRGEHGFDRWYYPPVVCVGPTSGGQVPSPILRRRIEPGRLVSIALGASTGEALGDTGTTVAFQAAPPPLVATARDGLRAVIGYSSGLKCVGELFIYARTWAMNHGCPLADAHSIGHALAPPEGWFRTGYPLGARLVSRLRRYQVHTLNPRPLWGIWSLGPAFTSDGLTAGFREAVFIDRGQKRILGRSSLDGIGRLPPA